jgi:tRNA-specific 2-thiouridylase
VNKGRVIVGMSGGVDSSVAAALLQQQGYDTAGVIMEIYDDSIGSPEAHRHACFGPGEKEDVEDAGKVAEKLGIPLYIVDLKEKYRKDILGYFVEEYRKGRTPNPCTRCNREMKFGAVLDELRKKGIAFDYFATGHYARIEYDKEKKQVVLKKAVDLKKDQSYFLYYLKEDQLKRLIFPLGGYRKEEVRELAKQFGIITADKPESQDFIAGGYHRLFDNPGKPGPILNTKGEKIGEHKGLIFYTVGQRRGIGIGTTQPLYVIAKDAAKNAIIVGTHEELMGTELTAADLTWVNFDQLDRTIGVKARIRYLHQEAEAEVSPLDNLRVRVKFKEPQRAITPGQVVVFYHGDMVLGGGIIEKEAKNEY